MKAYEKLLEKYKEITEGNKGNKGSEDFLKIPEGKTRIRILPAKNPENPFYVETIQHGWKIDGKYRSITCRKVVGEDCPMDEFISELWAEHNKTCKVNQWDGKKKSTPYSELARELKGKEKYYMNIVNRADESKVLILGAAKTLFGSILSYMISMDETTGEPEYGDITDLKEGRDFVIEAIKKPGASFVTYEQSKIAPKVTVAGKPDQILAWTEKMHDLQALVTPTPVEEIEKIVTELRAEVEKRFDEFKSTPSSGENNLAAKMAE